MWSKKSLCHNKTVVIRNANEPLCIYTGICKHVLDGISWGEITLNKNIGDSLVVGCLYSTPL